MPSAFVLTHRLAGENHPAVRPSGTTILSFQHDGEGGTHTLYRFADPDLAANFNDLVRGKLFALRKQAEHAYREATSA
jgi:hypothetical protein